MTGVSTRDEAIARLDRGLAMWASSVSDTWTQATTAAAAAVSHIEGEIHRRQRILADLHAAACKDNDWLRSEIARAEAELSSAQQARAIAMGVQASLLTTRRRLQSAIDGDVAGARANLGQKVTQLERYRGSYSVARSAVWTPPSSAVDLGSSSQSNQHTDFDPDDVDYSDNPIVGAFGKGGANRSDYEWATETWASTVASGIDRGLTRDDFAERDTQRKAPPFRRTADVYDLFTGDSQITLSRRANGTLEVINGRHRIEVARHLGIHSLPARIIQ